MKFVTIFVILISINFYSQEDLSSNEFTFYRNGNLEQKKIIKFSIIIENDTLECPIQDNKITLPKTNLKCSVLVDFKKKKYRIDDVDLSKISKESIVLFGIEKNLKNFDRVPSKLQNQYKIKDIFNIITIENYEKAKEICFISFYILKKDVKIITIESYSKTVITKVKKES